MKKEESAAKCVFCLLSFFFFETEMSISFFCREKCNFLSTVLRKGKEEREDTYHERHTADKTQTLGSNGDSGFHPLQQKMRFSYCTSTNHYLERKGKTLKK